MYSTFILCICVHHYTYMYVHTYVGFHSSYRYQQTVLAWQYVGPRAACTVLLYNVLASITIHTSTCTYVGFYSSYMYQELPHCSGSNSSVISRPYCYQQTVFAWQYHRLKRERDWKRKLPRIISALRRGLIEAVYLTLSKIQARQYLAVCNRLYYICTKTCTRFQLTLETIWDTVHR